MKYTLLVLFCLLNSYSSAQEFMYNIDMQTVQDNREYFNKYTEHKTIFGSGFNITGGIKQDEHIVQGGLHYFYDFGDTTFTFNPRPTLYYKYKKDGIIFQMGAFPRGVTGSYPLQLLNDTLNYYRPNVEGFYIGVHRKWGHEQFWIDWLNRQTPSVRESILFALDGSYNYNKFFVKHYVMMQHVGISRPRMDGQYLRDNLGYRLTAGRHFYNTNTWYMDSLSIEVGIGGTVNRDREFGEWETPAGLVMELNYRNHITGFKNTLFVGNGQNIILSERIYGANFYNRMDFLLFPIKGKNIEIVSAFSLHFIDDFLDYSQLLSVKFHLNN